MAEFRLPKNSVVRTGKTFNAANGSKHTKRFVVYRWDPSSGENPRTDTYEIDLVASTAKGDQLFRLTFDEWWSDSYGMWSRKVRDQAISGRFYATETKHAMAKFVEDLNEQLADIELPSIARDEGWYIRL